MATSFYNDRDAELGEMLTKILLENQQPVPDFLTQYVPDGFVADENGVYTGDLSTLKFETESDNGENEENNAEVETPADAGAWGNPALAPTPDGLENGSGETTAENSAHPAATAVGWNDVPAPSQPAEPIVPFGGPPPVITNNNWGAPQSDDWGAGESSSGW